MDNHYRARAPGYSNAYIVVSSATALPRFALGVFMLSGFRTLLKLNIYGGKKVDRNLHPSIYYPNNIFIKLILLLK